jgi:hypothetical protein
MNTEVRIALCKINEEIIFKEVEDYASHFTFLFDELHKIESLKLEGEPLDHKLHLSLINAICDLSYLFTEMLLDGVEYLKETDETKEMLEKAKRQKQSIIGIIKEGGRFSLEVITAFKRFYSEIPKFKKGKIRTHKTKIEFIKIINSHLELMRELIILEAMQ